MYENKGSVFAINQNIPIKETAYVTLTIDMHECTDTVEELLAKFKKVKGVKTANVLAIE